MEKQEQMMRLQMIQQEAMQLEEKLQTFEEQINDMNSIKLSIEDIMKNKNSEFLANLGKGIFLKSEIKDKDLFVNVGKNTLIKKKPEETIKIIENQIKKLILGKNEVMNNIEQLQEEMNNLFIEYQKKS